MRRHGRLRLFTGGCAALALLGVAWILIAGLRAPATGDAQYSNGRATTTLSRPAPELHGATLTGERFDLADHRGEVVVVNVWASWCDPCREELPVLAAAQRRWSAQGMTVIGIDMRDSTESARRLLDELRVSQLPSIADPHGTLAVAWGVRGVPETFLVDRAGTVRIWARGAVDAAWFDQHLPPLLRP